MRFILAAAAIAIAFPLGAQKNASSSHVVPPPIAQAVRRTHPISVDGRLDEPDWSTAPAITDLSADSAN